MNKLSVGDYIRTKNGIAKIISKNDDVRYTYPNAWKTDTYLSIYDDTEYVYEEDIIKSSPRIIDLIEVGDYVNGERVIRLFNPIFLSIGELPYVITEKDKFEEQDIKSIVTHEQFSQMMYKVGDSE